MANVRCLYSNVSERDMDMMFLQLFSTDKGFVRLFLDAVNISARDITVESIELPKMDPQLGESDITVLLNVDSRKLGLLIEDKIDAIAMPEQADRYVKRGEKTVENGEYDAFICFMFRSF